VQHRLVLIRHAEAAPGAVDAERPLTDHGVRQAAAVGRWLQDAGLVPDRVAVSPAVRAIRTWERAAGQFPAPPTPVVDERIYVNTVDALLAVIGETAADGGTVAVVGHNPSIGVLASILDDGAGDSSPRRDLRDGFPTAAVAVFTLGTPFDSIAPGTATLTAFTVPGA
jgi:phosphohistidine phosphatase